MADLQDEHFYDTVILDPSPEIIKKVKNWADKYNNVGEICDDVSVFVKNIDSSHLAKCKPLIKTHKEPPYPHRLLLSGSGTPTQFLSKFIQVALAHFTNELSFQLQDTKDFINNC